MAIYWEDGVEQWSVGHPLWLIVDMGKEWMKYRWRLVVETNVYSERALMRRISTTAIFILKGNEPRVDRVVIQSFERGSPSYGEKVLWRRPGLDE